MAHNRFYTKMAFEPNLTSTYDKVRGCNVGLCGCELQSNCRPHCECKPHCKPQPDCNPVFACDKPKEKVLVNFDFTKMTLTEFNNNFTNVLPGLPGFPTDGTTTLSSNGLFVNAPVFTSTIPVGNEHVKNLRYYKSPFPLSDNYETLYDVTISVEQYIPIENIPAGFMSRIRDIDEDIRLCCGAINTIDPETFAVTDIFIAKNKIYCFVERLPFGKTPTNNYAAYSAAFPASGRADGTLNDFVKLSIGLKKTSANYYINDQLVFNVPRFGIRLGDQDRLLDHQGVAEALSLNSSYFGFGLFTLLDMQLPNNYSRQLVENDFGNAAFVYPDQQHPATNLHLD